MSDHATTDTREIIVEILLSLEKGQDFSHKLMKAVLDKYDYLDPVSYTHLTLPTNSLV